MSIPLHFIANDIPIEWRTLIDRVTIPKRPLPPNLLEKSVDPQSLPSVLVEDPSLRNIPVAVDRTEVLLNSAAVLQKEINGCRRTLESAELKRREVASNAELIHGECDSQISAEQRLTIFVKSIDSILQYFDDLEKITIDFKSPLFTVLSPDFPSNLQKIEKGIHFFQMNQNFQDSKVYTLKYQNLQTKAVDLIIDHISVTLSQITHRLATNQKFDESIYIKFISVAPTVRRLFELSEKTVAFSSVLTLYKNSRLALLNPLLSPPVVNPTDIRSRASAVLTYARKEYELAREFFNFNGHPHYIRCFCELIGEIGSLFHDSVYQLIMRTQEIKTLCDTSIVIKGDVLQEEIGRIPVAAEKLRMQFGRVLNAAQERLRFRAEQASQLEIKGDTERSIELVSLLYYALPRDLFGDSACKIINNCLTSLEIESSKKFKGSAVSVEKDVYLLGKFLMLHDKLKNFDCQIVGTTQAIDFEPLSEFLWRILRFDRNFLNSMNGLSKMVAQNTVDCRKELENVTSVSFQSFTSFATKSLLQPMLNIKTKQIKDKGMVIAEVQKAEKDVAEKAVKITEVVKQQISTKNYKDAVMDVLISHLKQVIADTAAAVGETDEETKNAFKSLTEKVNQLSC